MKVRERVRSGIKTRLELVIPYVDQWPQAIALGARPDNLRTSLGHLFKISDEIWFQAGDKALDTSWYTKRFILTNLYVATEFHMI
mmetsp:Transcript_6504/g.4627  ORF Transcript_6504/g.4627 Transcript_6504/m.4627 type:complete len:85 (-) Transcript_6504:295-549(-)